MKLNTNRQPIDFQVHDQFQGMLRSIEMNLVEIQSMVNGLNDYSYNLKQDVLSGSSIGAHVRHVLEFYLCLFKNAHPGIVSYDDRERDISIETDRAFATATIQNIITSLNAIQSDRTLLLKSNLTQCDNKGVLLETSFFRELTYVFEHSIHHQALIKIGIKELNCEHILCATFGIAPSTLRNQRQNNNRLA